VYAYPAEHYADWRSAEFALEPGAVGENVSTLGAREDTVRIGDVWQWGSAVLQVSQPRSPCYRLGMYTGRREIIPAMIDSGRSGWYLRVLRPGVVPARGVMRLLRRDSARPTIAEVYAMSYDRAPRVSG
jgi:MOSC domain-containing protein YiiM